MDYGRFSPESLQMEGGQFGVVGGPYDSDFWFEEEPVRRPELSDRVAGRTDMVAGLYEPRPHSGAMTGERL